MQIKYLIPGLLLLFTVQEALAGGTLTDCGNISSEGTWTLANNVTNASTCFQIQSSNIVLDGQGYWINYSYSSTGYAIKNTGGYDNITIKNLNIVQGNASVLSAYAIYGNGMANSTITNNTIMTSGNYGRGIFFDSSSTNTLSNNNITTSGGSAYGIYLYSSSTNTLSSNKITTSSGDVIYFYQSSNSNTLSNNTLTTSGSSDYGINILSSSSNTINGGSIISKLSYDYSISGTTNNFTNTNFTASRKIYFYDATSWFNYNNETNGNIWLKTSINRSGAITRTLAKWSQREMRWNDTNSTNSFTANYNLTGLMANNQYNIYNTSAGTTTNLYTLTTDSNGALNFTIFLNGNTEITVVDNISPQISFAAPTPDNNSYLPTNYAYINVSASDGTNNITAFIDFNRSLVGWWRFNQEAGENSTFFRDWSSYGNNGTNGSNPAYTTGKFGSALQFDGVNDYVSLNIISDVSFSKSYSVSLWANINNTSTPQSIFTHTISDSDRAAIYISGGIIRAGTRNDGIDSGASGAISLGWNHIVFVHQANGANYLYLNAVNQTGTNTPLTYSIPVFTIGSAGAGGYFNGTIDEVRIYNRALSPEEINASFNAGSYRLYHNFTNLSDGAYTYIAYAQDLAGNVNQTETRILTADTTIPSINFISPTENNNTYWSRNFIAVNVSVTETNEANITFYLFNSTNTLNSTTYSAGTRLINFTNLNSNMVYWYNVTVRDLANNSNSTETRTITLDTTNPSISFTAPTENNNTYFNRSFIAVNVSASDTNEANITFYLFNSSHTLNSTTYPAGTRGVNFTTLDSNMVYWYNVTVRDLANNSNTTETRTITLDSTLPSISITSPTNNQYLNSRTISINGTTSDTNLNWTNISVYNLTGSLVNSTLNYSGTWSALLGVLTDGNFTINTTAQDLAGNLNSTRISVVVDTTPPTITLNLPANGYRTNQVNISLNYSASDSGIGNISQCQLWTNYSGVWGVNQTSNNPSISYNYFNLTGLNDSSFIWNVGCNDTLGNGGFSANNFTMVIDTVNPYITWNYPRQDNSSTENDNSLALDIRFNDANLYRTLVNITNSSGSSVYQNFTDNITGQWDNRTETVNMSSWNDGVYTIESSATDDHTKGGIPNLNKSRKGDTILIFNDTTASVSVTISAGALKSNGDPTTMPDDFNSTVSLINNEYYKFSYNFTVKGSFRKLRLTLNSSDYLTLRNAGIAHFVWGGRYYTDFRDIVNSGLNLSVLVLDSKSAYVDIWNDSWKNNDLVTLDPVTGGLNTQTEYAKFLLDRTPPAISFTAPTESNNTYFNRNFIAVNVSVTETNEANITFYLFNSSNTLNSTTYPAGTRLINFTNLNSNMQYWFNVTVRDNAGNTNTTETRRITLDSTSPVIINVSATTPVLRNAQVEISANVSDNIEISRVWASIVLPNGTAMNLTLNLNSTYKANFTNTSLIGIYNITVYANDTAGNTNSTNANFTVSTASVCNTASDCGSSGYTRTDYCLNYDVYNVYRTYTCNNPGAVSASCSYSDTELLIQDCGQGFIYYGNNYCSDNNVVRNISIFDRGCNILQGKCYDTYSGYVETVQSCGQGYNCTNGICTAAGLQLTIRLNDSVVMRGWAVRANGSVSGTINCSNCMNISYGSVVHSVNLSNGSWSDNYVVNKSDSTMNVVAILNYGNKTASNSAVLTVNPNYMVTVDCKRGINRNELQECNSTVRDIKGNIFTSGLTVSLESEGIKYTDTGYPYSWNFSVKTAGNRTVNVSVKDLNNNTGWNSTSFIVSGLNIQLEKEVRVWSNQWVFEQSDVIFPLDRTGGFIGDVTIRILNITDHNGRQRDGNITIEVISPDGRVLYGNTTGYYPYVYNFLLTGYVPEDSGNYTVRINATTGNITDFNEIEIPVSFWRIMLDYKIREYTRGEVIDFSIKTYYDNSLKDAPGIEVQLRDTAANPKTYSKDIKRISIGEYKGNLSTSDVQPEGYFMYAKILPRLAEDKNQDVYISPDTIPPSLSGIKIYPISPTQYREDGYQFNVTVRDNAYISIVILEFDGTNYTAMKSGDEYSSRIRKSPGIYRYRWHAKDTENWNSTGWMNYTVTKAPMKIILFLNGEDKNKEYERGNIVNITGVLNIPGKQIELYLNEGMIANGSSPLSRLIGTGNMTIGNYPIKVIFSGDENYTKSSATLFLTVKSTEGPVISVLKRVDPLEYGSMQNISANVVDIDGVDTVFIEFNGINHTMNPKWRYLWIPIESPGSVVSYGIYANDSAGNWNSIKDSFRIRDTVKPVITGYRISPSTVTLGDKITITATAIDNYKIDRIWAVIVKPSGDEAKINLSVEYKTEEDGIHKVYFYANDTSGNIASNITTFTVLNPAHISMEPSIISMKISVGTSNSTRITIENTGEKSTEVDLTADTSWISFTEKHFTILGGEAKEIIVTVSIPKNAKPGTYDFILTATTLDGSDTTLFRIIIPDEQAPEFIEVRFSNISYGEEQGIIAKVKDNVAVDSCLIDYGKGNKTMTDCSYSWVPDRIGEIPFTVYANDTSNNWNSITKKFRVSDFLSPEILNYSITPKAVIVNKTVAITADIKDNYELDEVWAEINSMRIEIPANYTPAGIGRYNVTIMANDTSGNTANRTDYFIVAESVQFEGNIAGYNQSGIKAGIRIYFPGTEQIINDTEFEGNFSLEIPNYVFDLDVEAFDGGIKVRLNSVDISRNIGKTLSIDKPVTDYLVTYSIESQYNASNATVMIGYWGIEYGDEDLLVVYKCDEWNFAERLCLSDWIEVEMEQNRDDGYLIVHTDTLSGFSIGELKPVRRHRRYMNLSIEGNCLDKQVLIKAMDNRNNDPLEKVDIDVSYTGKKVAYGFTNSSGLFGFIPEKEGIYEIDADRSGYRGEEIEGNISPCVIPTTTSTTTTITTTTTMSATTSTTSTTSTTTSLTTTTISAKIEEIPPAKPPESGYFWPVLIIVIGVFGISALLLLRTMGKGRGNKKSSLERDKIQENFP